VHISDVAMLEYYYAMVGWLIGPRPIFLTRHGMSARYPAPASEWMRSLRAKTLADAIFDDGAFIHRRVGVTPDLTPNPGLRPEPNQIRQRPEPDGPSAEQPSAVFVGRLEPDTGIDIYLDALALLQQDGIGVHLDVYGAGSLEAGLRSQSLRQHLPVVWHGRTEDAQRHLQDGCFAFVSGRMAIFEAMARRRLVIAAYVDPMKRDYILGEWFSRYIVSGHRAEQIAAKIVFYRTHQHERQARVERAYQAVQGMSWSRTAQQYLQVWREKIDNPNLATAKLNRYRMLRLAWQLRREARGSAVRLIGVRPDVLSNQGLLDGGTGPRKNPELCS